MTGPAGCLSVRDPRSSDRSDILIAAGCHVPVAKAMRCCVVLSLAFSFQAVPLEAVEIYVAAGGQDSAPGTANAPVATLQRARDLLRGVARLHAAGEPAQIIMRGGAYEMSQPLQLEAQDSDLVIKAADGENPMFLGAQKVEGFARHEGSILKADVSKLRLEKINVRQLLFGGERMILARWPNFDANDPLYGGWARVQEIPQGRDEGHKWKSELYVAEKDVRHWAHPEDVEIDIFAMYGWWNFIVPVKGFDAANRKLTLARDCGYDIHPHNRFHLQNALEELDSPGEWYLDKRTQTLYFWPPGEMEKHEVRIPTLESFIRAKPGAKNITLSGLAFHGCVGTALVFENSESCLVDHCIVTQCGAFNGSGISVSGHDNSVAHCEIAFTGSAGVTLNGGDRKSLTSANNRVENCEIHHVGVLNKNGPGISLGGVGNIVSHNLIHDCPRMAVQFSGNNLVIEYNRVHHTVLETQDGGAFYTGGRDWIGSRGSVIRYNFITDTVGVGQEKEGLRHPFFTWGIYMDDNTGGVDIFGNIVARSGRASLHLHNARDCVVENNIFVDGKEKQVEYDGWSKEQHYIRDHMPEMIKGWESVKDEPAWKSMRGMEIDPRNAFFDDGTMMSGNHINRNIIAWHDAGVRYVDFRYVKAGHNECGKNLIWNGGGAIRTPVSRAGADVGDDLLKGAGSFKEADTGRTPKGWGFTQRASSRARCFVQEGALVAEASKGSDPKNSHTVIHGPSLPIRIGGAYRLRLNARADRPGLSADFSFATYEGGKGYWQTSAKSFPLTLDWQEIEVVGAMPAKTEPQWKDWMKDFWVRVDVRGDEGSIAIKNVTIHEAEPLDQWRSWQGDGWDKSSVIADPLFVDESKDHYSLKPDSPAWKLGFEKIPVEKIGPVK
jgi:hypothetical protein